MQQEHSKGVIFDLVDDPRRVQESTRNNGPVTESGTTWKGEKRPRRSIMQGAASVSPYNRGSQRRGSRTSPRTSWDTRGTVHTGWASRTLEAKEERRWTGTATICGHLVERNTLAHFQTRLIMIYEVEMPIFPILLSYAMAKEIQNFC